MHHEQLPGVLMIAEEATSFAGVTRPVTEGGLGFDYKWNMGWMHDTLEYFSKEPIHRRLHQNDLTFGMLYQYTERFRAAALPRRGGPRQALDARARCPGDPGRRPRTCARCTRYMWAYPGKKLLFMGGEFAQ